MSKLITLPFDFNGTEYCLLVHIKQVETTVVCKVTIMNGALEMLLHGYHTFIWQDRVMKVSFYPGESAFVTELRQQIVKSLEEYLLSHPSNESIF